MKMCKRIQSLPEEPTLKGIRPMKKSDAGAVRDLLNNYGEHFMVRQVWSKKEVEHFFMPKDNVIYSYVVETDEKVTDFFSFYSLPSSILKHPVHKTLRAAYSYYIAVTKNSIKDIFECAIIIAKNEGFDVFNSLDVMENKKVFEVRFVIINQNRIYCSARAMGTSTIISGTGL
jgi:glycylpeptide N-tetradecanoyltransferase